MKRWQIFLFVTLTLIMISGLGYLGFQDALPLAQVEIRTLYKLHPNCIHQSD